MNSCLYRHFVRSVCVCACAVTVVFALENGLARTPPMGFNTWNWFGCGDKNHGSIDEALIKSIADSMASNGMKNAGYQFVCIDDCWGQQGRDSRGGIVAASRFPSGMKALADYVHDKGLKLGIYSDVAELTCAQTMPGMRDHEDQDADTFVAWGIDYVKVDWCQGSGPPVEAYSRIRNALRSAVTRMKPTVPTAHEIVISICNWGGGSPWLWGDTVGNLWRTTGDIDMLGGCGKTACWGGVMACMDINAGLADYAGPGHWNDPDMMEVGNGLPVNEDRAHFSLWCMMAAPLIAGNDIRSMNANTKAILTNSEAIAVNQDSLGRQGKRINKNGDLETWAKPLKDSSFVVLLFNRSGGSVDITVSWSDINSAWPSPFELPSNEERIVRDLWKHQNIDTVSGSYTAKGIPSHDVVMLRLNRIPPVTSARSVRGAGSAIFSVSSATSGQISVHMDTNVSSRIDVVNCSGKLVFSKSSIAACRVDIPVRGQADGFYIVRASSGNATFSQLIMVGQ
jgi:alpha-galactosidase